MLNYVSRAQRAREVTVSDGTDLVLRDTGAFPRSRLARGVSPDEHICCEVRHHAGRRAPEMWVGLDWFGQILVDATLATAILLSLVIRLMLLWHRVQVSRQAGGSR